MHVIKPSIKVVKTLKFTVKLVSYIKYKILKYQGEWAFISSYDGLGGPPIFWPASRSASCGRAVGSGGPFFLRLLLFLSLLFSWYVVYVGGASVFQVLTSRRQNGRDNAPFSPPTLLCNLFPIHQPYYSYQPFLHSLAAKDVVKHPTERMR
jgi:hypothetical protein